MKRGFYRLVMIIALTVACCSAVVRAESTPVLDTRFQYAAEDGYVWIVVDGEVTLYNKDLSETVGGFSVDAYNLHIDACGSGAYWVCANGNGECVMRIDSEGNVICTQILPESISVKQIAAYEGGAFLLEDTGRDTDGDDFYDTEGQIYVISDNGDIKSFDEAEPASTIACDGTFLYAYSEMYGEMRIYDMETGGLINQLAMYGARWFDVYDGYIYALKQTENGALAERIDSKDGSSRIILEVEYDAVGLRVASGYMYICDIGASTLYAYEIPDIAGSGSVLKIVLDSPGSAESARMYKAMELTAAKYPDVEFEFIQEPNDMRLLTAIMSDEAGYDVVFLQEFGGVSARNFYRSGALADLSESSVIMNNWEQLIDMDDIFGSDGGIFAVPSVVYPYVFQVNETVFEEYGLDIPEADWTWDEFFELGEAVTALRRAGEDIVLLADGQEPFFLMQYNVNELSHGGIDYSKPMFARNMESWRACVTEGTIEHTDYMYMYGSQENALFTTKQLSYSAMEDASFLQPPGYADYTGTPVYALSVGIVSLSDEREIAECFVASYISQEALELPEHYYVYGVLLKEDGGIQYPEFAQADMPTQVNREFWAAALENGVQYVHIDEFMYEQYDDMYWEYIAGDMDVEDFVTISQQKADMIMWE